MLSGLPLLLGVWDLLRKPLRTFALQASRHSPER